MSAQTFDRTITAMGGIDWAPTRHPLLSTGIGLTYSTPRQSFGVLAKYGQSSRERFTNGDVIFRWLAARAVMCPFGVRRKPLSFYTCAMFDAGILRGEPNATANATIRNGWWLAPGLGGLAGLHWSRLSIEGYLGLTVPLVRDEFFFAGVKREVVNHPGWIGPTAELRIGMSI